MLDNIRRKRSQVSVDLYKSVLLRVFKYSPKVLKLDLGKLRLGKKATKSFRYFGQRYHFSNEVCSIKNVEFKMLECPAGTFKMGHNDEDDKPPRPEVIEGSFLLGETEVTQELYEAVMGFNYSRYQDDSQKPVEIVSWAMAILFCNALSKLQGWEECYEIYEVEDDDESGGGWGYEDANESGGGWEYEDDDDEFVESSKYEVTCDFSKNGYRLPTEKEWEYAAKAGTNNKYAGTNKDNDIGEYAVYDKNSEIEGEQQTHPVKTKKSNEWGFYDMSGNVFEWCWDKYNPKNQKTSAHRVARGGSWDSHASNLISALRYGNSPGRYAENIGFRVCRKLV